MSGTGGQRPRIENAPGTLRTGRIPQLRAETCSRQVGVQRRWALHSASKMEGHQGRRHIT